MFFPILLFGQEKLNSIQDSKTSNNIGDCFGAIKIGANESVATQLIGDAGEMNDLVAYNSLIKEKESNSLWFSCETDVPGFLSVTLEEANFSFSYAAFLMNEGEDCGAIHKGAIKPIRYGKSMEKSILLFLLDSIPLEAHQSLLICINSLSPVKSGFVLISSFGDQLTEKDIEKMKKVYDFRGDITDRSFNIEIIDSESKFPLVSKVIISETKKNNALYNASGFIFPYADNLRMHLKIDANGYFYKDIEISLRHLEGDKLVIPMERIEKNQLIELEGLGFVSQTDVLLPEAYPKLRRLKDFMAINTTVLIDIQGHVHLIGGNSFRAKRLSKKRAKKVRQYLINSGIEKSRMSVQGYGNDRMKFPEAETDVQIQANRRVEIKIK